ATEDADLPRRVDHLTRPGRGNGRAEQWPSDQHQTGAGRRIRRLDSDPRLLLRARYSGLVRRDAGEWSGARLQRGARLALQLRQAGRHLAQRSLLEAGRGLTRMDHAGWTDDRALRPRD